LINSEVVEAALKVLAPILSLLLNLLFQRITKAKPEVVFNLVHSAEHPIVGPQDSYGQVHTHSLLVRNTGKETAKNVRVGHLVLPPSIRIYPPVQHEVVKTAPARGGQSSGDLVFPTLTPGEAVSIAYLYGSDLTVHQIHGAHNFVKSDWGLAKCVPISVQAPLGKV
jgi:hypothetical protein